MSKTFFIDKVNHSGGGPEIFGARLKDSLLDIGYEYVNPYYDHRRPKNNLSIIFGQHLQESKNFLRLDGLYLDSNDKQTNEKNLPIFHSYENFDHIIFQSEFSKKIYEAFTGTKKDHTIIHNGVTEEFFNAEEMPIFLSQDIKHYCVASASWRRHKRLEETIEAFRDERLKNVGLLVLGGLDYAPAHENKPNNVILLDRLSHEDSALIYKNSNAMIHLCWLDSCPNSVAESLAAGTPVLCSHNGGTKELVGKDGVVIQIEEDYEYGTRVPLYDPPKVDTNTIVEGVLEVLEIEKIDQRDDLKISNVASKYADVFV